MSAEPSLAYTADKEWHLTGGDLERLTRERDEARQERDHLRRQLTRKGESIGFDEALEALVTEAECFGLTKQAEKVQKALDGLRESVQQASVREAAMAEVRAAEEALRIAREKAGLVAPAKGKRGPYNISEADRERRREQCARMREARAAKRAS